MYDSFDNVEPGDRLIYNNGNRWQTRRLFWVTVERVTKTQVVVKIGTRTEKFRKQTGIQVGVANRYSWTSILHPTPERIATLERQKATAAALKAINFLEKNRDRLHVVADDLVALAERVKTGAQEHRQEVPGGAKAQTPTEGPTSSGSPAGGSDV